MVEVNAVHTVKKAVAIAVLAASVASCGSAVSAVNLNNGTVTARHRDRAVPVGTDSRRLRAIAVTSKLIEPTEPPKLTRPGPVKLARLIRVRFTDDVAVIPRALPNGNLVLCVPKRLRASERRAQVRRALRAERTLRSVLAVAMSAKTGESVSVVNDPA